MALSRIQFINRSLFVLLGILLIVSVALAGCSTDNKAEEDASTSEETSSVDGTAGESSDSTRTLTDALGNEVQIPTQPQRIIAPFLEDPLVALGIHPIAQWAAGGVPQQYLQNELKSVPLLNMDGGLKKEEMLSYNPDLIILPNEAYLNASTYEEFSKIAPTFVLSADTNDWRSIVTKLGEVLDKQSEANQALEQHDQKLAAAKEQLQTELGDKTAILLQGNDEKGFKLFGPEFYGGAVLYQGLGFKQPKVLNGDYELYSVEMLGELQDVDYIFVLSGTGRAKPPEDNALWQNLPAVKQGHVFPVDSGHWFNQNIIADGLIVEDVLRYVTK